jgi:signal transduction histidine kinase
MKPQSFREKEYRLSLLRTERRAIIPLKWFVWIVTLGLWIGLIDPRPPLPILAIFAVYALSNAIESYYFYLGRVDLTLIRPLTLISYLIDVIYVTMLIYFNLGTHYYSERIYGDFYILYFLLVMRGFALFTTLTETVLVNSLISILFILMIRMQQTSFAFVTSPAFAVRLVLIWLVLLMGWFIMVVLNQQKMDLIRVNEQLMRAENLVRVGELAAGVAHEINNPLGIITANTEFLMKITPSHDPRLEDIETIHRESNRCKEIIQQMLAYANPKPGEISVIDPRAINDEVLHFVFPRGRSGKISVEANYAAHIPAMEADPNLMKQALLNVYINAKQAIPDDQDGKITSRILSHRYPPQVVFEIEDTGAGISEEDLDHVFDPFFTRKPKGTGLGLPMTQRIVESFGGIITLHPVQPHGTLVRMRFPEAKV